MQKVSSWFIVLILALVLAAGSCSAGFLAARVFAMPESIARVEIPGFSVGTNGAQSSVEAGTPEDLDELFQPFWQAWEVVHEQYVDQPLDDEAMMRGAIDGMLGALDDQHTSYMPPEQLELANLQLSGEEEYEGIGAWVDPRREYLTIVSPMPGSPAEKAGLRPGDQIIAVDGEDMTGVDGELVRQEVIGPEGTTVRLTILREGVSPFDVTVERASINVPTVEYRMLEDGIAYIRLYTFGDPTVPELRKALQQQLQDDPSGLILDLRGNAGGFLNTAVDVASQFIADGIILYEEYGDRSPTTYEAKPGGLATEIPIVVLINAGSASASEIVAGAIQDHERGILVGETSFGKGSVQTWTTLVNNQGGIRVTIARWLTPSGDTIHEVGLEPDVVVEFTEEDFDEGTDPQLDKAIELLTQ